MTWAKRGCPVRALTFLTYGESEDQTSPHAGDYTRAFSRKQLEPGAVLPRRDPRAGDRRRARVGSTLTW